AAEAAHAAAEETRRLLAMPTPDPPLHLDADLRPEGRQGPLLRTLAAYRAYYERSSSPWGAEALLRATYCAGDAAVAEESLALADRLRSPVEGGPSAALLQVRRLKARMEAERLPRGADPTTHPKLGRGGLCDVAWTAQLIRL